MEGSSWPSRSAWRASRWCERRAHTAPMFRLCVAGLYLPRKTHLVDEMLKAGAEPRRLQLTMLRDIDAAEFRQDVLPRHGRQHGQWNAFVGWCRA